MAAVHGPGGGAIPKANMVGVNTESKLTPYVLEKKSRALIMKLHSLS